jgi:uncharacterized Zn-finger protein
MSNNVEFSIQIPSDNDGFISRQCPHCSCRFKMTIADIENGEILELFCPYCGLPSTMSETHLDEVIEQAYITATNYAYSMIDDFFGNLERKTSGNKHLKFKRGKSLPQKDDKVLFEQEEMTIFNLKCCTKAIKINNLSDFSEVYCPFCGLK